MTAEYDGRAKFSWVFGDVSRPVAEGGPRRILRIIVSGSPSFSDLRMVQSDDRELIKPLSERYRIEIVTTGGKGCDEMIKDWAISQGYFVSAFGPDWDNHKKKAPDVRNAAMIEYTQETGIQSMGITYIVNESRAARHVHDAIKSSKLLCVQRTLDWDSRVLVYPSNLNGDCSAGLAKAAMSWGGSPSNISGRAGQSYAVTMRDEANEMLPFPAFSIEIKKLIRHAEDHPGDHFLYNRVGCRGGEYDQEDVAALFEGAPQNISLIDAKGAIICLAAQWESALSIG